MIKRFVFVKSSHFSFWKRKKKFSVIYTQAKCKHPSHLYTNFGESWNQCRHDVLEERNQRKKHPPTVIIVLQRYFVCSVLKWILKLEKLAPKRWSNYRYSNLVPQKWIFCQTIKNTVYCANSLLPVLYFPNDTTKNSYFSTPRVDI